HFLALLRCGLAEIIVELLHPLALFFRGLEAAGLTVLAFRCTGLAALLFLPTLGIAALGIRRFLLTNLVSVFAEGRLRRPRILLARAGFRFRKGLFVHDRLRIQDDFIAFGQPGTYFGHLFIAQAHLDLALDWALGAGYVADALRPHRRRSDDSLNGNGQDRPL